MNRHNLIDKINSLSAQFIPHLREILSPLNHSSEPALKFEDPGAEVLHILHLFGLEGARIRNGGIVVELEDKALSSAVALLLRLGPLFTCRIQNILFDSSESVSRPQLDQELDTLTGLGVVWTLNQFKQEISGNIRVLFQPLQETTQGVEVEDPPDEVLENVKAVYGFRWDSSIPVGCVGINFGAIQASTDVFRLLINGKGKRTQRALLIEDPIQVAAHVVTALKQLSSRKIDPLKPVLISMKSIHSGNSSSQIPASVELKGTIHSMDEDTRKQAHTLIENTIQSITSAYGFDYQFQIDKGTPVLSNNSEVTTCFQKAAEEILGKEKVMAIRYPGMATQFAQHLKYIPGTFIHFGTGSVRTHGVPVYTGESPLYERSIQVGIKTLSWALLNFNGAP